MNPDEQLPPRLDKPYALTVGEGRTNPQGIYTRCEATVQAVAEALRKQPATIERWWSMHLWQKNKRKTDAWIASSGVVADIDFRKPESPPPELVEQIDAAARNGQLPGCIFHLTPHGARLIWVYAQPCFDRQLQIKAERGAGALIARALEKCDLTEYQVDAMLLGELARFFYTPNSIAKGVKRSAEVFILTEQLCNPVDLAVFDVPARVVEEPAPKRPIEMSEDFNKAVAAWNASNTPTWPKNSAPCLICGSEASFGQLPQDPSRWYCFSTNHPAVGIRGEKGYQGDALDLEAFKRGCKIIDVLRSDGYWRKKPEPPPPRTEADMPPNLNDDVEAEEPPNTDVTSIVKPIGAWRSRSYSTLVQILTKNARNVLENRKLELNEMSGDIEIGRKPIKDADAHRIRYMIEALHKGGVDKEGNQIGMQFSAADIFAAITQVAHESPYHPVREYLLNLKWDDEPYINKVVRLLSAEDIEINYILVKRFFVSAVARALRPGCKVDTVFILVGKQGARKSSFFAALSDPWFVDTPIDISNDVVRAYMTMRTAWLLEWAELEALLRAKRTTAVRAFLSSRKDSYVPKHARYSIEIPRGGVVVGTTNSTEFLEDEDGERRYWPVTVGSRIDLAAIAAMRDQLWAEAVALYNAGERWWLTEEEEALLEPRHGQHKVTDVWAERVLAYAAKQPAGGFTTADVLREEIVKEVGQWNRGDEMRISKILKLSGYKRVTDPQNLSRKVWRK